MPLPSNEMEWLNHLARLHDSDVPTLQELNSLYEGTAPLHYLHPEILREVGDRIKAVALGWPMLAVDPLEERLDVLGFRYPEDDDPDVSPEELASLAGDKNLQRVWLDNELDTESQLGHVDALVMKRAYIAVGANEDDDDTPLTTVESPLEVFAEIDPRTRATRAALRRWADNQDSLARQPEQFATLYLPNATIRYDRGPAGWREQGRDDHNLGEVPIIPLVNRGRLSNRYGRSELTLPLLSLSHAANKIATDMMVAAEFHAIPLRAIFGIGPDDLVDESGNRMTALQVILGRMLAIPGDDTGNEVKAHEFTASSLSNFHATLDQLAKHTSGLLGLDPGNFGITTSNPASADSIRAREARAIKRAERRQGPFGGSWRKWARLVRRFQDGDWDPRAKRIETIWRDAATPTRAQAADAAQKLFGDGPIITKRQAREDLGYTPGAIRRMEAEDEQAAQMDPMQDIAREMAAGRVTNPAVPPVPAGVG